MKLAPMKMRNNPLDVSQFGRWCGAQKKRRGRNKRNQPIRIRSGERCPVHRETWTGWGCCYTRLTFSSNQKPIGLGRQNLTLFVIRNLATRNTNVRCILSVKNDYKINVSFNFNCSNCIKSVHFFCFFIPKRPPRDVQECQGLYRVGVWVRV